MDKRKQENIRVKKAITEALFALMRKKSITEITITEIITQAGVSRSSYYRNYKSVTDILVTLVQDVLTDYFQSPGYDPSDYSSRQNIVRAFRTFRRYRHYLLDIYRADLGNVVSDQINRQWRSSPEYARLTPKERYTIDIHSGALANVAFQWLLNGMPESAEEMADIFCASVHV